MAKVREEVLVCQITLSQLVKKNAEDSNNTMINEFELQELQSIIEEFLGKDGIIAEAEFITGE